MTIIDTSRRLFLKKITFLLIFTLFSKSKENFRKNNWSLKKNDI